MREVRSNGLIGSAPVRIDGIAKVTGTAQFGADQPAEKAAYAWLVCSSIAKGKIEAIDETEARSLAGVLDILTYKNVGRAIRPGKPMIEGGYMAQAIAPLASNQIFFGGQIVAVVVAETTEIAHSAADALKISYQAEEPSAGFDSAGSREVEANALGETELHAGNLEAGFLSSDTLVEAWYETPAQHHNPLELFQTTCDWKKDGLTVWESTQNVRGAQYGLAKQLGFSPKKIHIISPFIGGAFGSRGELGQHTALIAFASRKLGRPVKCVATRRQGFTLRTFRAETRHHLRLGGSFEGKLTVLEHDSWEVTSRKEHFAVAGSESTARLYACPNVSVKVLNLEVDRQAPGFMRAPPETPYLFAMESAMDELSYALSLDPLEMRRKNDTKVDTVTNLPYTSRSLVQCIERGAELFGWSHRTPAPTSMREGDEFIGWGYATAFYPAQAGPAECRILLTPEGAAIVEIGTHEIGTGVRTVTAQTAADLLGLPLEAVEVCIGDSRLPASPMSAGSNSTASVCTVVAKCCEYLRERLANNAVKSKQSPLFGSESFNVRLREGHAEAGALREPLTTIVKRVGRGRVIVERATNTPHGAPPFIGPAMIRRGKPLMMGGSRLKDRLQFAHGAQFVEVRVNCWTGELRVPRMVGVFAAGRIMNQRTARSQLMGGQIWGLSSALFEASEVDPRTARYVNDDLAEYHIPVNADVVRVETVILPEEDKLVNPLGIKGVGEIGITGVAAAVANAIYHATGVRLRKLPIRVGDLDMESIEKRAQQLQEEKG